jgi:hypothetical protein
MHRLARLIPLTLALLTACAALPAQPCEVPAGVRVFESANIGEQWIDYVWVELPAHFTSNGGSAAATVADAHTPGPTRTPACPSCERPAWGTTPPASVPDENALQGRLFVASADPVGAIVPTMIDLPCADGPVDYAPAAVDLEFDAQGRFKTSYGWRSCAACSECYMHWTFSLDVEGQIEEHALRAELVLNETFHSGPMKLVSLEMPEVKQACGQPSMRCESAGACEDIRFDPRD